HYQSMAIVTGTDMRERPRGFALCLEDVLVKVSGDPHLRSDPRVAKVEKRAGDYVVPFNYVDPMAWLHHHDDPGTYDRSQNLTVAFDPAKIDALLLTLGTQPWKGPRPILIPALSVRGRKPPDYLLSADEPLGAEQRAAFERIAAEAGIPLRFPTASEFGGWGGGKGSLTGTTVRSLEGTIVIRGTLEWSDEASAGLVRGKQAGRMASTPGRSEASGMTRRSPASSRAQC
ncbi:DUF2066 domain-containing protein, partial [Limobrevibacterium gyesilva]